MEEPHPAPRNDRDAEGEEARHALRMERQLAIREGRYLPPLPQLPPLIQLIPVHRAQANEAVDRAIEFQLNQRRQFLLQHLRPEHFQPGGFFDPQPEGNYHPLSPQHSDEELDDAEEEIERQRRIRQNWRNYMNQRVDPIPQEIVDRLLREYDNWARAALNNNNGNFRNYNAMLSPSPSPSPNASPAPSDDEDPMEHVNSDDEDVEMLNAQMMEMRPNQPRPRKRHNSQGPLPIKRKRVTFKEDSSDEVRNFSGF